MLGDISILLVSILTSMLDVSIISLVSILLVSSVVGDTTSLIIEFLGSSGFVPVSTDRIILSSMERMILYG